MYDWPEIQHWTDRFWTRLRDQLVKSGVEAPIFLDRETPSADIWRDPGLLFSQTCGYPYAVELKEHVALLGAPHYDVEGCGPGTYSCAVIVAASSPHTDIGALSGQRFAFNGRNSLSGYRGFSTLVGDVETFTRDQTKSGGHRQSMDAVEAGVADFALIDGVCWWLYQRAEPAKAAGLRVLTWTAPFPALPFITSLSRGAEERAMLQHCLKTVIASLADEDASSGLPLIGIQPVQPADYAALAAL